MIESSVLWLFVLAAVGILLSPGPAVLYVVTTSLAQGAAAGVASQVGLCSGLMVHVLAVAAGVSAALVQWPWMMDLLRFLGAGYLVWLAISTWRSRLWAQAATTPTARSVRALLWRGFVIDTLNPKPALFMLAFLPQFADPDRGPMAGQLVFLGILFVTLAFVTGSAYAFLAGSLSGFFRRRGEQAVRAVSASVLLGLAVAVVVDR